MWWAWVAAFLGAFQNYAPSRVGVKEVLRMSGAMPPSTGAASNVTQVTSIYPPEVSTRYLLGIYWYQPGYLSNLKCRKLGTAQYRLNIRYSSYVAYTTPGGVFDLFDGSVTLFTVTLQQYLSYTGSKRM